MVFNYYDLLLHPRALWGKINFRPISVTKPESHICAPETASIAKSVQWTVTYILHQVKCLNPPRISVAGLIVQIEYTTSPVEMITSY